MCGIAGMFAYHDAASAVNMADLLKIRDHMAARGPDGAGLWQSEDGRVGLAHRRLAIIDLSDRGAQPMVSADGRYRIVFNGEIYNHLDLKDRLQRTGVHYASQSDTETLLHLYAQYGADVVRHVRGMFAFAIWDAHARELFLARDLYGIKPLYYANDGWTFTFASQVKALLSGGHVSRDLDPAGRVGFHLWGSVPEPFTLYRDVRALPAGHTMTIDRWGPREPICYDSVSAILARGRSGRAPSSQHQERLTEAARNSVRRHLLSDVPVGVFLSAGVDSGAILGLMHDLDRRSHTAITLGFSEFANSTDDEVPLASEIARRYGARHMVYMVGRDEFQQDLPRILDAMDQPTIDGINTWFVAKAARQFGLKVALSGLGGDELLAGYPSFVDIPRWRRRFGLLSRVPALGRMSRWLIDTISPASTLARPKAKFMLEYARSWPGGYLLRRGLHMPEELPQFMDRDECRDGLDRLQTERALHASLTPDPGSDVARVAALEATNYMKNQLLRDADWAGMAHSLEIRTPLVDAQLLEDVAPIVHAIRPGEGKRLIASAPSVPLPANVVERPKTGFSTPIAQWMGEAASLATSAASATARGLVSRRWSRYVDGLAVSPA